jgi:hypothetical protein
MWQVEPLPASQARLELPNSFVKLAILGKIGFGGGIGTGTASLGSPPILSVLVLSLGPTELLHWVVNATIDGAVPFVRALTGLDSLGYHA